MKNQKITLNKNLSGKIRCVVWENENGNGNIPVQTFLLCKFCAEESMRQNLHERVIEREVAK